MLCADERPPPQGVSEVEGAAEDPVGRGVEGTGRRKSWWKGHELFADRRCSQAAPDFFSSTEVGKIVPAVEFEDDAGSEVSEWELQERREREEERRAEELGAEEGLRAGKGTPLFLPTPPFMASAEEEE